jgi:hypothetical protein
MVGAALQSREKVGRLYAMKTGYRFLIKLRLGGRISGVGNIASCASAQSRKALEKTFEYVRYGVVGGPFALRGAPGPRGATPAIFRASGKMRYLNAFFEKVAGLAASVRYSNMTF